MYKKVLIILFSIVAILLITVFAFKDVIFQEGNPIPIIKAIIQLNENNTYIQINDSDKYITKTNDKDKLFSFIEKENNVKFKEQMGSGYIFEGDEKSVIVTSKQYTRFYQVWKINKDIKNSKNEIENLVNEFGKKLKMVSLLAPKEILTESMNENYKNYITDELLAKWINDPQTALGKLVSSPWPERIEIVNILKINESKYIVIGEIIEITSVEAEKGGIAAKKPVILYVKKVNDKWLINDVSVGGYVDKDSITYVNDDYGFIFSLPKSWENYSIINEQWNGLILDSSNKELSGPVIYIRNPNWTKENVYQDIPIMIFTHDQWQLIQDEKLSLGAAPIPPSELGQNDKYVFALPARYNYAFNKGYEEVENILKTKPLMTFNK